MACHDHDHSNETKAACSTGAGACETNKPCWFRGFIIPTAVVFAILMAFNYLFHGNLMMPHYEATKNLWRPMAEMEAMGQWCLLRTLGIAAVLSLLYCCHTKHKPCCGKCPSTGIKFGLMIGLLLGIWDFGHYIWMPIPMSLALAWLFGNIVLGVLIGWALSCLKKCLCKSA